jgi:hypothetical protein
MQSKADRKARVLSRFMQIGLFMIVGFSLGDGVVHGVADAGPQSAPDGAAFALAA